MRYTFENIDKKERLDVFLSSILSFSRSRVQVIIKSSFVTVNDVIKNDCSYLLKFNDCVDIDLEKFVILENNTNFNPYDINVDVVYQDDDLLVINKQSGLCVHPGVGNYNNTLVNALVAKKIELSSINGDFRPGIVHRLDKDTSGLMIIAKNNPAHEKLSKMIFERKVKRKYKAIVFGLPSNTTGTIANNLSKDRKNHTKMMVNKINGKYSVTHYKVLEFFYDKKISLLECELETGRTHQIRVHMSHIGHSIVGDQLYGKNDKKVSNMTNNEYIKDFKRQALHSYYIEFLHPFSEKSIKLEIDLPSDMQKIISR